MKDEKKQERRKKVKWLAGRGKHIRTTDLLKWVVPDCDSEKAALLKQAPRPLRHPSFQFKDGLRGVSIKIEEQYANRPSTVR